MKAGTGNEKFFLKLGKVVLEGLHIRADAKKLFTDD